ncbi:hypothetical protein [Lyngbya aestuarii]|uniref:hypothetical protein n=1 Tax=Lyngbya aestuarii TaxID=118322 RepID=UPI00403D6B36
MADKELPDSDYVSRCTESLENWQSKVSEDSDEWKILGSAIYICNTYKETLPRYKSILPDAEKWPPRKKQ